MQKKTTARQHGESEQQHDEQRHMEEPTEWEEDRRINEHGKCERIIVRLSEINEKLINQKDMHFVGQLQVRATIGKLEVLERARVQNRQVILQRMKPEREEQRERDNLCAFERVEV